MPLFQFVQDCVKDTTPNTANIVTPTGVGIDIARFWRRMLDLEANDRPEINVHEEIASRDGTRIFRYRNLGRSFDYDPEDNVDAYLHSKSRAAEVELSLTDGSGVIAFRNISRHISQGDRLYLSERREQTSIDRRAKALDRILARQSAIPDLIDYFSPSATVAPQKYDVAIEQSDLDAYSLNEGQQAAFRKLLLNGPIGLLQGPPGTGKTRFIAALVHWLVTKGGARKILIASQSHEAVNNAIESLVLLYKNRGGRPNLLRIGSKGITERIRPFHTAEIRDRYRLRFEGAMLHRFL